MDSKFLENLKEDQEDAKELSLTELRQKQAFYLQNNQDQIPSQGNMTKEQYIEYLEYLRIRNPEKSDLYDLIQKFFE